MRNENAAPSNIDELIDALRDAALRPGESAIDWTGKNGLFWRAAEVIEGLSVCADAAMLSTADQEKAK